MKIYENLDINNLEGEIWKIIEDFPDYSVSNLGRVKSFIKWHGTNERILKQTKAGSGYFKVDLCKNGQKKYKLVHRLVYETFKEKLEKGYDAHHINEDREDNFVENLESKPHSNHTRDHHKDKIVSEKTKIKISKKMKGKNNSSFGKGISNQKITDIEIDIKKGYKNQKEVAEKHGVCQNIISRIKTGKIKSNIGG